MYIAGDGSNSKTINVLVWYGEIYLRFIISEQKWSNTFLYVFALPPEYKKLNHWKRGKCLNNKKKYIPIFYKFDKRNNCSNKNAFLIITDSDRTQKLVNSREI